MSRRKVWIPPLWVRLFVITPIVYVGTLLITLLSPLLHVVLAILDLVDRKRWRFTRVGGLAIAFCVTEFVGLTLAFVLWVASGFGWKIRSPAFQRAHNRVLVIWMELVTGALRFFIGFDFMVKSEGELTGPVLAFVRHAGPGDIFLLSRTFARDHRLDVSAIGTTKLLLDPFFDRLVRRLPFHFIDQNPASPDEPLTAINDLVLSIDDRSVLMICPEGGNWTPDRWEHAIERLEERGQHDRAALAAEMRHVLPPRTSGAVAALQARDDVTVIFVAHVGLEDLRSLRAIWRAIPIERQVQAAFWSVPREEIPDEPGPLGSWLYEQWRKVDEWIDEHEIEAFGRRLVGRDERVGGDPAVKRSESEGNSDSEISAD